MAPTIPSNAPPASSATSTTDDGGRDRTHRQRRQDCGPEDQQSADVWQNIRDTGEDGDGECAFYAGDCEQREDKHTHQRARDDLAADVAAHNSLEIEQHARECDVMRTRHDREKRTAQSVPVEHHVQRQEDGANRVCDDLDGLQRRVERELR